MSLQGLPDFQRPLHGFKYQIFYPFENAGGFVVASSALEIGNTPSGRPDFLLELIRGISPATPPKPYAVVDFRVRAVHPAEDALTQIRKVHTGATVAPPVFRGGFLRLQPAANTGEAPEELFRPAPLAANGLGVARFVTRLGAAAGAVIEGALKGEVLGLLAWAEMEMEGVAPRVPVKVTFDPAALLGGLAKLAADPASPVVTRDQIEAFFEQDPGKLPLRVEGTLNETARRDFVEAMADLVRVRYGESVASPATPVEASVALRMKEAAAGETTWDLSEPLAAPRVVVASLDPFDAARQLVKTEGIGAFVKHTVVPPLSGGTRRVHVAANLPAARAGLLSLGVHLTAAPKPPHRMKAIQETLELAPPADAAVATLKMSMAEPLEYEYSTWAVMERAGAVERLENPPRKHQGEMLDLGVNDFPVQFVTIEATAALLSMATITGTCTGKGNKGPFEKRFELTPDQPAVGLAVPSEATLAPLNIEARELGGAKSLRLTVEAAQSALLDLTSFREFGPQRIRAECDFSGAASDLLAVDLVPEGREQSPGAIQTLAFTPAAAGKEWGYLAASPFRAGYRYRIHAGGEPSSPWSDVQPPSAPLRLRAADTKTEKRREIA